LTPFQALIHLPQISRQGRLYVLIVLSVVGHKRTDRRPVKIDRCPLWSKNGPSRAKLECPLSANICHWQTLFDHRVEPAEQRFDTH
jgi:hypothetical protein